jgi:hypothetical protein
MVFTAETMNALLVFDPIYDQLAKLYCSTEALGDSDVFIVPNDWNNLRKKVLLRALRDELYPMLWTEAQVTMAKAAEREVCRLTRVKLLKLIDVQPYRQTDTEWQGFKDERRQEKLDEGFKEEELGNESDDEDLQKEKLHRTTGVFFCARDQPHSQQR